LTSIFYRFHHRSQNQIFWVPPFHKCIEEFGGRGLKGVWKEPFEKILKDVGKNPIILKNMHLLKTYTMHNQRDFSGSPLS
jgi:hypothetical protein